AAARKQRPDPHSRHHSPRGGARRLSTDSLGFMSLGSVVVWHWWWLLVGRRGSPGFFGLLIEVAPSRPASLYSSREGPSRGPTLHGSGSWQWRLGSVVVWHRGWLLVVRGGSPGLFGFLIQGR